LPRCYFDLEPGLGKDTEGEDLPNDEAAQRVAAEVARELARNRPPGRIGNLVVSNEQGAVVYDVELASFGTVADPTR
jgi:hypothetical protein